MLVSLQKSVEIIKKGGVVAFPTETVYGLGADATNAQAISKVFEAKNRPKDNPLICHFYSTQQIMEYLFIPPTLLRIMQKITPGPVSFVLPIDPNSVLKPATAGQKTVIVRIPNHPLALKLIEQINKPIVGPSANTSGKTSGTTAQMVENDLGEKIDGILDGKDCLVGLESTILDGLDFYKNADLKNNLQKNKEDEENLNQKLPTIKILRPGIIGQNELTKILTELKIKAKIEDKTISKPENNGVENHPKNDQNLNKITENPVTPGAKYPHYSPNTPVLNWNEKEISDLVNGTLSKSSNKSPNKIALIYFTENEEEIKDCYKNLDKNENMKLICFGSLRDIGKTAHSLYKNLIQLDSSNLSVAYFKQPNWQNIQNAQNTSLSLAIQNRLKKVIR